MSILDILIIYMKLKDKLGEKEGRLYPTYKNFKNDNPHKG